eukprot:519989_1
MTSNRLIFSTLLIIYSLLMNVNFGHYALSCAETRDSTCVGQTLISDDIYCKGSQSCQNSIIFASNSVHLEGFYAANKAYITARNVYNFGYGGGNDAIFDTVAMTTPRQSIDEMTLFFKGVASSNGAIVVCRGSATCHIYCDGDSGCKGLKIYVSPESLPKLTINPYGCINDGFWNQKIDGILCPELISTF